MTEVKVGSKVFTISEVPHQDVSMTKVDWLAERFYKTRNEKYINVLIRVVARYIQKVSNSFCKDAEDAKELSQELKIDLLRLLRGWKPKEGMRFNYLMRKQFYNFSCNFIKNLKSLPLVDIMQIQEGLFLDKHNFDKDFETKDLVEKLLLQVDDKTREVLKLMLRGVTSCEKVGEELNITGMAVRNRMRKCKPILQKILREGKNV